MITFKFPESTKPFFLTPALLDGAKYYLRFEWNSRAGWFVGLLDEQKSALFAPRKLVPDFDLLRGCADSRRPPGILLLEDASGKGETPGRDDLGGRFQLHYFEREDLT